MRYIEDPRINEVARLEHMDMLVELCRRYAAGEDYFHARTVVMAERGPKMAQLYGKAVAERAMRMLCSHAPSELPSHIVSDHLRANAARDIQWMDDFQGLGHQLSSLQRFVIDNPKLSGLMMEAGAVFFLGSPLVAALPWLATWQASYLSWLIGTAAASAAAFLAGFCLSCVDTTPRRRGRPTMTLEELEQHRAKTMERLIREAGEQIDREEAEAARRLAEIEEQRAMAKMFRAQAARIERDARANANNVLPKPPPLDDVGRAILRR